MGDLSCLSHPALVLASILADRSGKLPGADQDGEGLATPAELFTVPEQSASISGPYATKKNRIPRVPKPRRQPKISLRNDL